jgi:hypothetical protein
MYRIAVAEVGYYIRGEPARMKPKSATGQTENIGRDQNAAALALTADVPTGDGHRR